MDGPNSENGQNSGGGVGSLSRRDFLKLSGLGVLVTTYLTACGVPPVNDITTFVTPDGSIDLEKMMTEEMMQSTVRLEVKTVIGYSAQGIAQDSQLGGTGLIVSEVQRNGVYVADIYTAKHVVYTGSLIASLNLASAFNKFAPVNIDATIGAPNGKVKTSDDYAIENLTDLGDGNVLIRINSPVGGSPFTKYGGIPIIPMKPKGGTTFLSVGCPYTKERAATGSILEYVSDGKDSNRNPCWVLNDPSNNVARGSSGGPLFVGQKAVALIQGGVDKIVWATPLTDSDAQSYRYQSVNGFVAAENSKFFARVPQPVS